MKTTPDPTRRTLLRAAIAAPLAQQAQPPAVSAPLAAAEAAVAGPLGAPAATPQFVHLADFALAGGHHHGLGRFWRKLPVGTVLDLMREPDNPHDPSAVAVHHPSGVKLGYVPRAFSMVAASLLDSGVRLRVEVMGELHEDWQSKVDLTRMVFTSFLNGDPHLRLFADDAMLAARFEQFAAIAFGSEHSGMEQPPA